MKLSDKNEELFYLIVNIIAFVSIVIISIGGGIMLYSKMQLTPEVHHQLLAMMAFMIIFTPLQYDTCKVQYRVYRRACDGTCYCESCRKEMYENNKYKYN